MAEKVQEALNFLKEDLDKAELQWTQGLPFQSLLQRADLSLEELLEKFNADDDENEWCKEYKESGDSTKLITLRRRLALLKSLLKEFHEEYDPAISDVDFMRLLELPYTEPRYVIESSINELGGVR